MFKTALIIYPGTLEELGLTENYSGHRVTHATRRLEDYHLTSLTLLPFCAMVISLSHAT